MVEPRRQWPTGLTQVKGRIAIERQPQHGRALARLGDGGWNPIVDKLILAIDAGDAVVVPDQLVTAIAAILNRWDWSSRPTWICPMPSRRRSSLIDNVAEALGVLGKLPVHRALMASASAAPDHVFQSDQANSAHQVLNVWERFAVDRSQLPPPEVLVGPVLVVDDEIDSRWTITVAAWQLTGAGAGPVLPFALRSR